MVDVRDVREVEEGRRYMDLGHLKGLLKGAKKVGLMIGYANEMWYPGVEWLSKATIQDIEQFVTMMAGSEAVQLVPLDREMTTQGAAEFLGISRPSLIKLVEAGEIPCLKPTPGGRHRRLRLKDVVAFRDRLAEEAAERGKPLLEAARARFLTGQDVKAQ